MNKEQLIAAICNGREDAYEFVNLWLHHINNVDDTIDGDIKTTKDILGAFNCAIDLVRSPFFRANEARLYTVHILASIAYAHSVEFLKTKDDSLHKVADILRSYGNEMLILVAGICSKEDENVWDRMFRLGIEIRKLSWAEHHDSTGRPH